jgi:hypothetical protein
MAVKATEPVEPEEAGAEVMIVPSAVAVAIMPEAPTVDLLNHRRGLSLLCHTLTGAATVELATSPRARARLR